LETVRAQCDEIILIDNGNPDAVGEWLDQQEDVQVIRPNGNVGFALACNMGAKVATSEFLLFLNPDAELEPDCVVRLAALAGRAGEPSLIGAKVIDPDVREQRGSRRDTLTLLSFFTGINRHTDPPPAEPAQVEAVSGSAMLMSAESFRAVDGFDTRYFLHVEDLDICRRVRAADGQVWHHPRAVVRHQGASSDAAGWVVAHHKRMSFKTYMLTYYPRVGRLLWPAMSLALRARSRGSRK
jgi:GT2 family glycosyltransferase